MKSIAVHSFKGGVGKTTISLILAKHAVLSGLRTCVLDFDFIGAGMNDLYRLARQPQRYLESFLLDAAPQAIDVAELLAAYGDDELGKSELSVILNMAEPSGKPAQVQEETAVLTRMERQVAAEPRYHEVEAGAKLLLPALEKMGFELAVFDCHPGLSFVSAALRRVANLHVYVTTPNRSDCFGLLKAVNNRQLDDERSFLVLNRAEEPLIDLATFREALKGDALRRTEAAVLFGQLRVVGKREGHFAVIRESTVMRGQYNLGSKGYLPDLGRRQADFGFADPVLALL